MALSFDLAPIRLGLYVILTLFSFILLALTAARLHYTNNIPRGDGLNGGRSFTDPSVGELLFTSLITMIYSSFAAFTLHKRLEKGVITSFMAELVCLGVLWLFWLGGMAAATSVWPSLSFCMQFEACRVLTAMVAFSWFGWILISLLLAVSVLFTISNKAWQEPMHGRWDPTKSAASSQQQAVEGSATAQREMSNV